MAPEHEDEVARFQPLIDALTAHVTLLDADGTMVGVNSAWMRFSVANGNRQPNHGIGLNYLTLLDAMQDCVVCDPKQAADVETARVVAEGIRDVLAGRKAKFQLEYPCDSPNECRWFLLTVSALPEGHLVRAIVAHEDLTPLKLAKDEALRQTVRALASFGSTVDAIALAVEKRDPYTAGHQQKVAALAEGVGRVLGLSEDRLRGLLLGAKIHDIGKIAVPTDILMKPTRLSAPEMQIIRTHCEVGAEILHGIDFPWPIADIVRQHHERLDGSGYPSGLTGDQICLEARIVCVADVFDAITSHRPYRGSKGVDAGIAELVHGRGVVYDNDVVDALLQHLQR